MHIQIYSKENCPFCTKAVKLAEKVNSKYEQHTYEKFMLNKDFTREELMELCPYAKTFPQITIDKIKIGGYNEFKRVCRDLIDD